MQKGHFLPVNIILEGIATRLKDKPYICVFFSEELVKNRDFQTGGAAQYIPDKAGDRKKNIGTSKRKSLAKVKCQGVDSDHRPKAYESSALPLSYPGNCYLLQSAQFGLCVKHNFGAKLKFSPPQFNLLYLQKIGFNRN